MVKIREMTIGDYDDVIELMKNTNGIAIRDADSKELTERYLIRNPGLSFIAEKDSKLIGCVMCGYDGRRGYLQHLIVIPEYRKKGIGKSLVGRCLAKLHSLGIYKTHIDVLITNTEAICYWERAGWKLRDDIVRFSYIGSGKENA